MKKTMSIERLRELLDYDPETGVLTWKVDKNARARKGDVAGSLQPGGYRATKIDRKSFLSHRIAWAIYHGYWPTREIDHINAVRDDNRLSNLREATRRQNRHNTKAKGYYRCTGRRTWKASITPPGGKLLHLGCFETEEAAKAARIAAEKKYYGEFRRRAND